MIDVRIGIEDFSINQEWAACRQRMGAAGGAIVVFGGLVRDQVDDSAVTGLLLEHYPNMTEASIRKIAEDASTRWDLLDIVIVHRVGHLELGDQIVMVLVGSAHRPDAFDACEYIMDYLKTEAIFWKKEFRGESSDWIKSTSNDYQRRDGWE
ncbi:MAG: molybdenum cofactor biosynthesis protein MoaE [Pseudomonadales bacterium]|nr:molybdenum cofactor biosynthesis protein MoaE [Pseudomonadales bacterium]